MVIELHTDDGGEHCLKLRSLSAETDGKLCEMVIPLADVHLLTKALLDAAADLFNE